MRVMVTCVMGYEEEATTPAYIRDSVELRGHTRRRSYQFAFNVGYPLETTLTIIHNIQLYRY